MFELRRQCLELLLLEHSGDDPSDLDRLRDLVDLALDEVERHGLHQHPLDLVERQLGAQRDVDEGEHAVVGVALEHHGDQAHQHDLLLGLAGLRHQRGLRRVRRLVCVEQSVEVADQAVVHRHQQLQQPLIRSAFQRIHNGVSQYFTEVVYILADDRCDRDVCGDDIFIVVL